MPTKKIVVEKKTITREDLLKSIEDEFTQLLPALKEQLGEKKFEKRLKKAGKLLVAGIKKAVKKKEAIVVKKPVKAIKKDPKTKKAAKKVQK